MLGSEKALPIPGMPKVEFLDEGKTLARWTFASADLAAQRAEFNHWLGWFGFDEGDQPHAVEGNTWLVRKHG
ncbi:MAG: hypothetical protein JWQ89_2302 [Devosia sp.]|nr:hypothetical protein [Devosia sp.]